MGAMKKLHAEYGRSGWDLTGFPKAERKAWRRLLPPERRGEREGEAPTVRADSGPDEAHGEG